jgi:hypothetical protein
MGKEKVLVFGNDNRSFLTVIRSLGRKGLEIKCGRLLVKSLRSCETRRGSEVNANLRHPGNWWLASPGAFSFSPVVP